MYGVAVQHGAELAVKEINEAGGINGAQIEFNFQDDEHDAEKSVNAYNTLKDWARLPPLHVSQLQIRQQLTTCSRLHHPVPL